jgi:3-deoxy-D-manno-octulosonic-acid transferase
MLDCFSHFFVQNEASFSLLESIGINQNVTLSGDTRFDRVIAISNQFTPIPSIESFIGDSKQVIVAGSTWLEDDEILYHYTVTHPHVKFIIAPHDIQQSRIEECMNLYKNAVTFSQWLKSYHLLFTKNDSLENGRLSMGNILIIDNIGMLSSLYNYATVCFVGGAFGIDGVHNVLEAAVYGKPVIFGPEYNKYLEAVELIDSNGAISVENKLELERAFNQLFTDQYDYDLACKNAKKYVFDHAGATSVITRHIHQKRLLTN